MLLQMNVSPRIKEKGKENKQSDPHTLQMSLRMGEITENMLRHEIEQGLFAEKQ